TDRCETPIVSSSGLVLAEPGEHVLQDREQALLRSEAGAPARTHVLNASRERACLRARFAAELHHEGLPHRQFRDACTTGWRASVPGAGSFAFHAARGCSNLGPSLVISWKVPGHFRERFRGERAPETGTDQPAPAAADPLSRRQGSEQSPRIDY